MAKKLVVYMVYNSLEERCDMPLPKNWGLKLVVVWCITIMGLFTLSPVLKLLGFVAASKLALTVGAILAGAVLGGFIIFVVIAVLVSFAWSN